MEYDKVAAIRTWPTPKNLTELRGFLGLASFYRRHCQSFSKLAVPLTDMLKKDKLFEWTEESTKAFETLKDTLSSAPLLIVPDPNLDYEIDSMRELARTSGHNKRTGLLNNSSAAYFAAN